MGIWATPGKGSIYRYTDVVAWGCVRLEVKTAEINARNIFAFRFSLPTIKAREIDSDFVVLCMLWSNSEPEYSIIPATHSLFKNKNGVRHSVEVNPFPNGRGVKQTYNALDVFREYQNAWNQIEQRRQEVISELLQLS